jgi:ketosteroid isomerase-like protein
MKPFLVLLLAPLLIAAAPWSRDQQAIIDHGNQWSALYEAGKVDEMRPLYEADAWLMTQGAPLAKGVDAILAFLKRNKERGNAVSFAVQPEQIVIDGRYAFLISKYWMTITPPGKNAIDLAGRSMLVFKRGKDRRWRIWRDMDNFAPDVRKEDRP